MPQIMLFFLAQVPCWFVSRNRPAWSNRAVCMTEQLCVVIQYLRISKRLANISTSRKHDHRNTAVLSRLVLGDMVFDSGTKGAPGLRSAANLQEALASHLFRVENRYVAMSYY